MIGALFQGGTDTKIDTVYRLCNAKLIWLSCVFSLHVWELDSGAGWFKTTFYYVMKKILYNQNRWPSYFSLWILTCIKGMVLWPLKTQDTIQCNLSYTSLLCYKISPVAIFICELRSSNGSSTRADQISTPLWWWKQCNHFWYSVKLYCVIKSPFPK